jgi:molybdopterin-containing oxidoreductase family membrane subunit
MAEIKHRQDIQKRNEADYGAPIIAPDETFDIIGRGNTLDTVTSKISDVVLRDRLRPGWVMFLGGAAMLAVLMLVSLTWLILMGVGVWGNNQPVSWAWDIINFVWWIGIGHAGTLISAILLLVHQNWRTSINRFAEAMTIFAVICAATYPAMHIGRHQYFYWLIPLPNSMGLYPQFRSPLEWDFFAVSTYATVSILFWYVGLIPDLAVLRDRAKTLWVKKAYAVASLGWRNSAQHWHRYMALYMILAGISTPLVLSVHSTISYDFAMGIVPGWHTTIFPPYFVAGAVFAGFAMVLILAIPLRALYGLKDLITMRHLENCAKVMLATGLIVCYGYAMEIWTAWYSANTYEQYMQFTSRMRMIGENPAPYAWSYWALWFCNGFVPQILWFRWARTNVVVLFLVSIVVSIGMWLERFVIIVVSLSRDYLPSSWGYYSPTIWDVALYAGTFGLFFTLFLLFIRILPSIAIAEMRELVHHESHHGHGHDTHGSHGHAAGDDSSAGGTPAGFSGDRRTPEIPGQTQGVTV